MQSQVNNSAPLYIIQPKRAITDRPEKYFDLQGFPEQSYIGGKLPKNKKNKVKSMKRLASDEMLIKAENSPTQKLPVIKKSTSFPKSAQHKSSSREIGEKQKSVIKLVRTMARSEQDNRDKQQSRNQSVSINNYTEEQKLGTQRSIGKQKSQNNQGIVNDGQESNPFLELQEQINQNIVSETNLRPRQIEMQKGFAETPSNYFNGQPSSRSTQLSQLQTDSNIINKQKGTDLQFNNPNQLQDQEFQTHDQNFQNDFVDSQEEDIYKTRQIPNSTGFSDVQNISSNTKQVGSPQIYQNVDPDKPSQNLNAKQRQNQSSSSLLHLADNPDNEQKDHTINSGDQKTQQTVLDLQKIHQDNSSLTKQQATPDEFQNEHALQKNKKLDQSINSLTNIQQLDQKSKFKSESITEGNNSSFNNYENNKKRPNLPKQQMPIEDTQAEQLVQTDQKTNIQMPLFDNEQNKGQNSPQIQSKNKEEVKDIGNSSHRNFNTENTKQEQTYSQDIQEFSHQKQLSGSLSNKSEAYNTDIDNKKQREGLRSENSLQKINIAEELKQNNSNNSSLKNESQQENQQSSSLQNEEVRSHKIKKQHIVDQEQSISANQIQTNYEIPYNINGGQSKNEQKQHFAQAPIQSQIGQIQDIENQSIPNYSQQDIVEERKGLIPNNKDSKQIPRDSINFKDKDTIQPTSVIDTIQISDEENFKIQTSQKITDVQENQNQQEASQLPTQGGEIIQGINEERPQSQSSQRIENEKQSNYDQNIRTPSSNIESIPLPIQENNIKQPNPITTQEQDHLKQMDQAFPSDNHNNFKQLEKDKSPEQEDQQAFQSQNDQNNILQTSYIKDDQKQEEQQISHNLKPPETQSENFSLQIKQNTGDISPIQQSQMQVQIDENTDKTNQLPTQNYVDQDTVYEVLQTQQMSQTSIQPSGLNQESNMLPPQNIENTPFINQEKSEQGKYISEIQDELTQKPYNQSTKSIENTPLLNQENQEQSKNVSEIQDELRENLQNKSPNTIENIQGANDEKYETNQDEQLHEEAQDLQNASQHINDPSYNNPIINQIYAEDAFAKTNEYDSKGQDYPQQDQNAIEIGENEVQMSQSQNNQSGFAGVTDLQKDIAESVNQTQYKRPDDNQPYQDDPKQHNELQEIQIEQSEYKGLISLDQGQSSLNLEQLQQNQIIPEKSQFQEQQGAENYINLNKVQDDDEQFLISQKSTPQNEGNQNQAAHYIKDADSNLDSSKPIYKNSLNSSQNNQSNSFDSQRKLDHLQQGVQQLEDDPNILKAEFSDQNIIYPPIKAQIDQVIQKYDIFQKVIVDVEQYVVAEYSISFEYFLDNMSTNQSNIDEVEVIQIGKSSVFKDLYFDLEIDFGEDDEEEFVIDCRKL